MFQNGKENILFWKNIDFFCQSIDQSMSINKNQIMDRIDLKIRLTELNRHSVFCCFSIRFDSFFPTLISDLKNKLGNFPFFLLHYPNTKIITRKKCLV